MAGFRKAAPQQAALKMAIYGPPGSGKTFTSCLLAEGLATLSGKRTAYVDTEHGTDFYSQNVEARAVHPAAFDFDALYTRSITEALREVRALDHSQYGVVVLDSVTHLWQACIEAYTGKQTGIGTIPMHAWGKIKKPYKELMEVLLSSPLHVLICGRQGTEYATDEESEEMKAVGYKMKAEGETAYEPHVLIRMEATKPKKTGEVGQNIAYVEKDRTGVLSGRTFVNPGFDALCKPMLHLLGGVQAQMAGSDATAAQDGEELARQEQARLALSAKTLKEWRATIDLVKDHRDWVTVGKQITPEVKARLIAADLAALREHFASSEPKKE